MRGLISSAVLADGHGLHTVSGGSAPGLSPHSTLFEESRTGSDIVRK